jgi:hypothetical protein
MANTQQDLFQSSTVEMTKAISSASILPISELVNQMARRRTPRSIPARRRVTRQRTAQNRRRASPNGNTEHAEPIRAETSSNPSQDQQKPDNKPEIICVTLNADQAKTLSPILDRHRQANRIMGLLCTITRSYRPSSEMITVELQVLEADQRTIAALRKIACR